MKVPAASPWWMPHVHAARRPVLLARMRIKAAIRAWLDGQGFVEVDPACLQVSPGNEAHLHAFRADLVGTDLARHPRYLHTSPEFAMKKLLAAGEQKIFAFTPVFRNRERGPLHAPEFTMLEWYRAGEDTDALQADCAHFLRLAATVVGQHAWSWRGRTCDVTQRATQVGVDDAFARFAGVALSATYGADRVDRDALAATAAARGFYVAADDTWSDIFAKVLTAAVEPELGAPEPQFLTGYPAHEAALARPDRSSPSRAERFELYICGVELANGFGELTDSPLQRRRLIEQMDLKERIYGERYPLDEDFLAALAYMPAASGCALGFDRLVMLATGAPTIDHVLWTPAAKTSDG